MFRGIVGGAVWLATSIAIVGCSSSSSSPPADPIPELDLHTSCVQRAAWQRTGNSDCSACEAHATAPACSCLTGVAYNGECNDAEQARIKNPDCTSDLNDCVDNCATTDCDCVTQCFVGHDSCNTATAQLDSCVLHACGSSCN